MTSSRPADKRPRTFRLIGIREPDTVFLDDAHEADMAKLLEIAEVLLKEDEFDALRIEVVPLSFHSGR